MKKSYSKEITDAQVMLSGIKANIGILAKRKIDDEFTAGLTAIIEACIDINNEQEALKARLKEKTEALNKQIEQLQKKTSEARKIIKLDIPQASWKEFGIADKK